MKNKIEDEIMKFKDWKTGEDRIYTLNEAVGTNEQLTDVHCPFDETPLIFAYDHLYK